MEFVVAMTACTLVVLAGIFMLAVSIYKKQSFQAELLLLVLACVLIPLVDFFSVGSDFYKAPMIHDITTETENPPVFVFIQPNDGYRINPLIYPERKSALNNSWPTWI